MEKITRIVGTTVILLFGLYVGTYIAVSVVSNFNKPSYELTQTARETTAGNAFVSGCVEEGGKRAECQCGYDKMKNLYPDFDTNEARLNRIITEGYNSIETDAFVKCFGTSSI